MAKKSVDKKEEMQRVCEQMGVNKLYYNTKGEYFTEPGYAYASEAGDKKKVGVYIATADKEEVNESKRGTGTGKAADKTKVGVGTATTDKEEVKEPEGGTDE